MNGQMRFTGGDVLMKRLGVNPPMQLLWRLSGPLDADAVKKIHALLAEGPLNRRLTESRLPLARPLWTDHHDPHPPRISDHTIDPREVLDWADEACRVQLDAHQGRGWELSAADITDGTSVVSLVGSHALADGQGLISAVTLAARGVVRDEGADRPWRGTDLADIVTEGAKTYARLAVARLRARFGTGLVAGLRGTVARARPVASGASSARSRHAVSLPASDLERVARAEGGSVTGLMMAMTANILRAARDDAGGPFTVAMPVSFRSPDDMESSNMVGMATVQLEPKAQRYTELSEIRRRCKAAYASVRAGQHLTGYPTTDAALSNGGELPEEARIAFGPAFHVLLRTVSGGGSDRGRMNSFVLRAGDTVSLVLQSAGVVVGQNLVEAELDAWGITAAHWW